MEYSFPQVEFALHNSIMITQNSTVCCLSFFFQMKVVGKAVGFLDSAEHIPIVDKAVDVGWKREVSNQRLSSSKGL